MLTYAADSLDSELLLDLARHANGTFGFIPDAKILATDISDAALAVARKNAEALQIDQQITFSQGDLLEALNVGEPVDLILSNPPYIGRDEQGTLDENVRKYEPEMALFAGQDGMAVIDRLILQAPAFLNDGGFLIFEISPMIAEACRLRLEQSEALDLVKIAKDYSGNERIVVARKS